MTRPIPTTLLIAAGCAALGAAASAAPSRPPTLATGTFTAAGGAPAGTTTIVASPKGSPVLRVKLSGLPTGVHGIHIHAVGKCEAPGFTTAGGHLNPAGHQHGKDNPAGSHLGDLPNVTVDAQGKGELTLDLPGTAEALRGQLFDADGAAVVVHAAPDDYRTDPSGNSGARIACAVLSSS